MNKILREILGAIFLLGGVASAIVGLILSDLTRPWVFGMSGILVILISFVMILPGNAWENPQEEKEEKKNKSVLDEYDEE